MSRTAILTVTLFWSIAFALIYKATHMPPAYLPSRPVTELTNFGQGRNPSRWTCEDHGVALLDAETGLFIECMRGTK